MFDPHGTRRNRRRVSRQGQIIQAKALDPAITIDPRLVPLYRDYLTANNISAYIPPTPTPPEPDWDTQCPIHGYITTDNLIISASNPLTTDSNHVFDVYPNKSYIIGYFYDNQARLYLFTNTDSALHTITEMDFYTELSIQSFTETLTINNLTTPSPEITLTAIDVRNLPGTFSIQSNHSPFIDVPQEWVINNLSTE